MKKILFIILSIICFTGIVNAEKCTVVTGTGTNIGDEIACGTEHFYILNHDGEEVQLLSKYNLYIGKIYIKLTFTQERYQELVDEYEICNVVGCFLSDEIFEEPEFSSISPETDLGGEKIIRFDDEYTLLTYDIIKTEKVKQDKTAIGAHGDKSGQPEFPEVGVIKTYIGDTVVETYAGGYMDIDLRSTYMDDYYLPGYEEYLSEDVGLEYLDIDVPTVKVIDDLVYRIKKEHLPLEEWISKAPEYVEDQYHTEYALIGSIKDEIPEGYEWIYSTTYWTRTKIDDDHAIFVDTLGNFCSTWLCGAAVGAGLRPIITIDAKTLNYAIKTKTDGHGTVKSEKINAYGGEVIKFTVEPDEGYVLGEVKVTDGFGNVIIFKEDTFTMPYANVLIEATFVKVNPATSDIAIMGITIICIVSVLTLLTLLNKRKTIKGTR